MDGTIVASSNKLDWKKNENQWILFEECKKGLTIRGSGGVFDGHGEAWWDSNGDHGSSFAPHVSIIFKFIFNNDKSPLKSWMNAFILFKVYLKFNI